MSIELSYGMYSERGLVGQLADSRLRHVDTLQAYEKIPVGCAVVRRVGSPNECRLPRANKANLVFAGDLVASNTINLKINGVAITQVTYATSHANTIDLLVAAILAHAAVSAATDPSSDSNNRTIAITAEDGLDLAITEIVVAAGAGQTTGSATYTTVDSVQGFALHEHATTILDESDSLVKYPANSGVNVLRQGALYVRTEEAVTAGDDVHVRFKANGAGKTVLGACRNDVDSSTCVAFTGVKFDETTSAAGYAKVVINQP
jgi:hypothetical protein